MCDFGLKLSNAGEEWGPDQAHDGQHKVRGPHEGGGGARDLSRLDRERERGRLSIIPIIQMNLFIHAVRVLWRTPWWWSNLQRRGLLVRRMGQRGRRPETQSASIFEN